MHNFKFEENIKKIGQRIAMNIVKNILITEEINVNYDIVVFVN